MGKTRKYTQYASFQIQDTIQVSARSLGITQLAVLKIFPFNTLPKSFTQSGISYCINHMPYLYKSTFFAPPQDCRIAQFRCR